MTTEIKYLARFTSDQIRRIVMVGNRSKYLKSMDRVIADIFDYPKLATKVASSRNEDELLFVLESFGFDALDIFRDSQLYGALEDLVHMDYDLRKLKRHMEDDKKKRGKVLKSDMKVYDRIAKLYRRTVKAICNALNIKHRRSARFKNSYQGAKGFLKRQNDRDFFGSFGVWDGEGNFYPEEDDLYFGGGSVDYFEEYMSNLSRNRGYRRPSPTYQGVIPRYQSSEMLRELDDDEEEDDYGPDSLEGSNIFDYLESLRRGEAYQPRTTVRDRQHESLYHMVSGRNTTTPTPRARQNATTPEAASSAPADKTAAVLDCLVKKMDTTNDLLVMLTQQMVPSVSNQSQAPTTFTSAAGNRFHRVQVAKDDEEVVEEPVSDDEAEEAALEEEFNVQNQDVLKASTELPPDDPNNLSRKSLIDMINGERAGAQVDAPIPDKAEVEVQSDEKLDSNSEESSGDTT